MIIYSENQQLRDYEVGIFFIGAKFNFLSPPSYLIERSADGNPSYSKLHKIICGKYDEESLILFKKLLIIYLIIVIIVFFVFWNIRIIHLRGASRLFWISHKRSVCRFQKSINDPSHQRRYYKTKDSDQNGFTYALRFSPGKYSS